MKKWKMNFQAITNIEIEANSYTEAIKKGEEKVIEKSINQNLIWSNFKVLPNTVEVVEK